MCVLAVAANMAVVNGNSAVDGGNPFVVMQSRAITSQCSPPTAGTAKEFASYMVEKCNIQDYDIVAFKKPMNGEGGLYGIVDESSSFYTTPRYGVLHAHDELAALRTIMGRKVAPITSAEYAYATMTNGDQDVPQRTIVTLGEDEALPLDVVEASENPTLVVIVGTESASVKGMRAQDANHRTRRDVIQGEEDEKINIYFNTGAWVGIFVTLFLLFGTIFAVQGIANIESPERFDNPKSKYKIDVGFAAE